MALPAPNIIVLKWTLGSLLSYVVYRLADFIFDITCYVGFHHLKGTYLDLKIPFYKAFYWSVPVIVECPALYKENRFCYKLIAML